ncbi:MAG: biotin transporter BioY [Ignavibacteriaceae bacterium]|jgi:biotin transport system substrate-specific component|nr:biotin transporter BioY [bacterium BMS3Abin03]
MAIKENAKSNVLLNTISVLRTSQIFWILSFSLLTVIGAQVAIPVNPVPFTLQTMIVLLAGALLGPKNGAYSQLIYLAAGAIGLPVFAGGTLGIGILFGTTGGYLLAFPLGAFLTGYLVQKYKSYIGVILSMIAGNLLIIFTGTLFLFTFYLKNLEEAIIAGAAIFTFWMALKIFAAATIYFGISKKNETLP